MVIPGRSHAVGGAAYRYGMNGQEKENEVFDAAFSAEFWMYDSRLGRRWEDDPLTYPWQSPYTTFNNNPIYYSDPSGLEGEESSDGDDKDKNKKKEPSEQQKKDMEDYNKKHQYWEQVWDDKEGKIVEREKGPRNSPDVDLNGGSNTDDIQTGSNDGSDSNEKTKEVPETQNPKKEKQIPPPTLNTGTSGKDIETKKIFKPKKDIIGPLKGANPPNRTPDVIIPDESKHIPKNTPPPTPPNPELLCFDCFIGKFDDHWNKGVASLANWLMINKDFKIELFADGGQMRTWDAVPAQFNPTNATTIQRVNQRYQMLLKDVREFSNGKIFSNRLYINYGTPSGNKLMYKVVK